MTTNRSMSSEEFAAAGLLTDEDSLELRDQIMTTELGRGSAPFHAAAFLLCAFDDGDLAASVLYTPEQRRRYLVRDGQHTVIYWPAIAEAMRAGHLHVTSGHLAAIQFALFLIGYQCEDLHTNMQYLSAEDGQNLLHALAIALGIARVARIERVGSTGVNPKGNGAR